MTMSWSSLRILSFKKIMFFIWLIVYWIFTLRFFLVSFASTYKIYGEFSQDILHDSPPKLHIDKHSSFRNYYLKLAFALITVKHSWELTLKL